jgi:hypothetical protein
MGNIISESDYRILVERVLRKEKMPRRLISDFSNPACRSMMGRYMTRCEQNYQLGARILETVIHHPMVVEEDYWCLFDYSICRYNCDHDVEMALVRIHKVRRWVMQHEDQLMFLSVAEINQVLWTLRAIKHRKLGKSG